jgi:Collagen triple helix repeat (20 copies)
MTRFLRMKKKLIAAGVVAGLLVSATVAAAWFVRDDGTFHVCVFQGNIGDTHVIRALEPGEICGPGEEEVVINLQGPKGDTGATGATGAQGPKGDTGAQGPKGDTGATGAKGDTGAQGPKGDTGAQGPKGDTGAAGAPGLSNVEQVVGPPILIVSGVVGGSGTAFVSCPAGKKVLGGGWDTDPKKGSAMASLPNGQGWRADVFVGGLQGTTFLTAWAICANAAP